MRLLPRRLLGLSLTVLTAISATAHAGSHNRVYVLVAPSSTSTTTTTTSTTAVAADSTTQPTTTRYVIREYVPATADTSAPAQAPTTKAAAQTPTPTTRDADTAAPTRTVVRYVIRDAAPASDTAATTTTTTTTTTTSRNVLVRSVAPRIRAVTAVPVQTYEVREVAPATTSTPTYILVRPKHRLFSGW